MLQTSENISRVHDTRILMVDDELNVCTGCKRMFEDEGYITEYALSGKEGIEMIGTNDYDLVITDLKMPDVSGMDVIKTVKERRPETPVIMITGYPSRPTAVEAMKLGAADYIPKPFKPDEIIKAVKNAIAKVREAGRKTGRPEKGVIDKNLVMEVLGRANDDGDFRRELMEKGSDALLNYNMGWEAKAAIVSGDVNWIEKNVGKLTDEEKEALVKRSHLERW